MRTLPNPLPQLPDDPLHLYAATLVLALVAALLGDYLERSEGGQAMVQRMFRLVGRVVKGIPRA